MPPPATYRDLATEELRKAELFKTDSVEDDPFAPLPPVVQQRIDYHLARAQVFATLATTFFGPDRGRHNPA